MLAARFSLAFGVCLAFDISAGLVCSELALLSPLAFCFLFARGPRLVGSGLAFTFAFGFGLLVTRVFLLLALFCFRLLGARIPWALGFCLDVAFFFGFGLLLVDFAFAFGFAFLFACGVCLFGFGLAFDLVSRLDATGRTRCRM